MTLGPKFFCCSFAVVKWAVTRRRSKLWWTSAQISKALDASDLSSFSGSYRAITQYLKAPLRCPPPSILPVAIGDPYQKGYMGGGGLMQSVSSPTPGLQYCDCLPPPQTNKHLLWTFNKKSGQHSKLSFSILSKGSKPPSTSPHLGR